MYLEEIHDQLELNATHYSRWAKTILKKYTKDEDYFEEINAHKKISYRLTDEVSLLILDKYGFSKGYIKNKAEMCETNWIRHFVEELNRTKTYSYDWFITNIRNNWVFKNSLPKGYIHMIPSEISYSDLLNAEYIDETFSILEDGILPCVAPTLSLAFIIEKSEIDKIKCKSKKNNKYSQPDAHWASLRKKAVESTQVTRPCGYKVTKEAVFRNEMTVQVTGTREEIKKLLNLWLKAK